MGKKKQRDPLNEPSLIDQQKQDNNNSYKKILDKLLEVNLESRGLVEILVDFAKTIEDLPLTLLLIIAEYGPITTEEIIQKIPFKVSKSTTYRKLSLLASKKIIERKGGVYYLTENLKNLTTILKLRNI